MVGEHSPQSMSQVIRLEPDTWDKAIFAIQYKILNFVPIALGYAYPHKPLERYRLRALEGLIMVFEAQLGNRTSKWYPKYSEKIKSKLDERYLFGNERTRALYFKVLMAWYWVLCIEAKVEPPRSAEIFAGGGVGLKALEDKGAVIEEEI